ncbi:hypothetical protein N657DRAFT_491243 [Parathielavia appendiculata]|uniref:Uncharacterized protein n=1 Tax=Parathielavia appendiculata TaxID=2587402 RepID=A0AAN6Z1P6_9PEZI|nr:hypothetical protein N657DRAFT_491243 [Parathielavia appendiculata]
MSPGRGSAAATKEETGPWKLIADSFDFDDAATEDRVQTVTPYKKNPGHAESFVDLRNVSSTIYSPHVMTHVGGGEDPQNTRYFGELYRMNMSQQSIEQAHFGCGTICQPSPRRIDMRPTTQPSPCRQARQAPSHEYFRISPLRDGGRSSIHLPHPSHRHQGRVGPNL